MSSAEFQRAITGLPFREAEWFDEIDSTNSHAMRRVLAGAELPLLYAAATQTAGRGRFERRWLSTKHASLAFSLAITPNPLASDHLSLYPALAGLAVAEALSAQLGIETRLKWPNDILINQRKTAGILVEAAWRGAALSGVIIGIGINLLPDAVPPADAVMYPASCLAEHTDRSIEPMQLLADIAQRILAMNETWNTEMLLTSWRGRMAFAGEAVLIKNDQEILLSGILEGIDDQGNLQIMTADGSRSVVAGDVHLRPGGQA